MLHRYEWPPTPSSEEPDYLSPTHVHCDIAPMALMQRKRYTRDRHDFKKDDASHVLLGYWKPENPPTNEPLQHHLVLYWE